MRSETQRKNAERSVWSETTMKAGSVASSTELAHEKNIENMQDDGTVARPTGRLNQQLINVFEDWLQNEVDVHDTASPELIVASMNGLGTIVGTIMANLPKEARPEFAAMVRRITLEKLDKITEQLKDV